MFNVQQAADKLGISPSLLYRLVSERKVPHFRIGTGRGGIRITEEQLQNYLEDCRVDTGSAAINKPPLRHLSVQEN